MKHFKLVAALLITSATFATATVKGWTTDFEAAKAQAKKEGKEILLDFTGSDWCPPARPFTKMSFPRKPLLIPLRRTSFSWSSTTRAKRSSMKSSKSKTLAWPKNTRFGPTQPCYWSMPMAKPSRRWKEIRTST